MGWVGKKLRLALGAAIAVFKTLAMLIVAIISLEFYYGREPTMDEISFSLATLAVYLIFLGRDR